MTQQTEIYKRSLAGSVGAGIGSLFKASGKTYFVLEHKVTSKYHRAGESQKIIVDQIELGRDPKCQVRFDESFQTVSRKHAAIVRDGSNWKLVQLSKTNATFLNGRPVNNEWYLQNGDEIQLAVNGPKMGFIVPQGKQSMVSSINFTERLTLFRKQALKPYKQAILGLSVILLLAIGGLVSWNIIESNNWKQEMSLVREEAEKLEKEYQETISSVKYEQAKTDSTLAAERKANQQLKGQIHQLRKDMNNIQVNDDSTDPLFKECLKHVYYIQTEKIEVTLPDGKYVVFEGDEMKGRSWAGTGFMLKDGRFVTARHVVDFTFFNLWWNKEKQDYETDDTNAYMLNLIDNNGGKVIVHFGAYSCSGEALSFTNRDFVKNVSNDKIGRLETGNKVRISPIDSNDWAYIRTNVQNGLGFDLSQSTTLKRGTKLRILGYPNAYVSSKIEPLSGSASVAIDGLDKGCILITERNFEQGNSGGPVLYRSSEGKLSVVGLVSAGRGETIGFIVPLSAMN